MPTDIVLFLLSAFLASVLLVGIHTYLGIHVLSRNVIFVDLGMAQISALGATVAFMLGYLPQSAGSYGYSLAFTLVGALILALSRNWVGRISQETFVGVTYVVAAAAAFLLVDRAPQGAEHVKQLLIGSILTVTYADLLQLLIVYAVIGVFHWLLRERFLLLSISSETARRRLSRVLLWDFLFYASFGVVVTSSVAVAGVLLVFSFLIIPAAIGALYSKSIRAQLIIGWAAGTLASALGLIASYGWDLPTGAAMVCVFGLALIVAALLKPGFAAPAQRTRGVRQSALRRLRSACRGGATFRRMADAATAGGPAVTRRAGNEIPANTRDVFNERGAGDVFPSSGFRGERRGASQANE